MTRRFLPRRGFLQLAALGALGALAGANPVRASANRDFEALNAMRFVDMPDFANLGLKRVRVVYSGEMWPKGAKRGEPDLGHLTRSTIPKVKREKPGLVIVDIEHWSLDHSRGEDVERNIARYVSVLDTFRAQLPGSRIGLYGMVPIRNYWAPVKNDTRALSDWRDDNRRLAPLAAAVDIVFPSLYTFYEDREGWQTYAAANIAEARQYGKPVYPFLWPQYHKGEQQIDAGFWRLQLDTVYDSADGLVIWSPARGRPRWNPDAPWWHQTVEFLQAINAK